MQRSRQRKIAGLLSRLDPEDRNNVGSLSMNEKTKSLLLRREVRIRKAAR